MREHRTTTENRRCRRPLDLYFALSSSFSPLPFAALPFSPRFPTPGSYDPCLSPVSSPVLLSSDDYLGTLFSHPIRPPLPDSSVDLSCITPTVPLRITTATPSPISLSNLHLFRPTSPAVRRPSPTRHCLGLLPWFSPEPGPRADLTLRPGTSSSLLSPLYCSQPPFLSCPL